MFDICSHYCVKSKNLYNFANYHVRQLFINEDRFIKYRDLSKLLKTEQPFKDIGSNSGQMTLRILEQNWKSFFAAIKDWSKNPHKYLGRPKLPKYLDKEKGRFVWVLTNVQSKIVDGFLKFSFKPLKKYNGIIKTKVVGKHMQTRIVPRDGYYNLEIVYQIEVPSFSENSERILGIDIGLSNLVATQNNFGESPFVINGNPIKSINTYYNKKKSRMQSELKTTNNKSWSRNLGRLTTKRNSKIDDYMHKASRWIINYCIAFKVDTIVIGKNKKWKQENRMKNFIQVPYEKLINQIKYKAEEKGIKVVLTEESYTSKASFLDQDKMRKGEFSGERIQR